MRALRLLSFILLVVGLGGFALPGCSVVNAPDDAQDPDGGSGGRGVTSSISSGGGTDVGGSGTGGDDCVAPMVTSPATLVFTGTGAQYELTFDADVRLEAGAVTIDGGAMVTLIPSLPATGSSFTIELSGLSVGTTYTLRVDAMSATDDCGNPLPDDITVAVSDDCDLDTDPPTLNVTEGNFPPSSTTASFVLEFSEPTTLQAGAVTATNGANVVNVMPALPATATSFTVDLSNINLETRVVVAPNLTRDACGNMPVMPNEALLCPMGGGSVTFASPGNSTFVVPACAKGMVSVVAYGAQGGGNGSAMGGQGGMAMGDLTVMTGESLQVRVGGQGLSDQSCGALGGANGGGNTGFVCCSNAGSLAGTGGGASDVRQGGINLASRVIVAGGGGGAGSFQAGGAGGGVTGADGVGAYDGQAATGGTQTSGGLAGGHFTGHTCSAGTGGSLGQGGVGDGNDGGGGGGGLYGGGGGANNSGGAGGSSFIGGVMAGVTMPGMKTGNGEVVISW